MIWRNDLFKIEFLLDYVLELNKKNAISLEDVDHIPFLDWLHSQIMNSIFVESNEVVEGLKDARNTIIIYQDEGEFPWGEFTPKDSQKRDDFIVEKTLQFLKINLSDKEKKDASKYIAEQYAVRGNRHFLEKYVDINSTGRDGPAWYYPTTWTKSNNKPL